MKKRFKAAITSGGALASALVLAGTASASSYEVDIAAEGSPDPNVTQVCVSSPNAEACFQPYGDYLFIKDAKADGMEAYNEWTLSNGSTRSGQCINQMGAPNWGYCNKDFPEGVTIQFGVWYNGVYYSKKTTT